MKPLDNIEVEELFDDEKFKQEKRSRKKYYKRMLKLHRMQAQYENKMNKEITGVNLLKEVSFSKKVLATIIYSSLFMLFLSYILAFMDKEQIAETLSSTIAQVVFSSVIAYFGKALLENTLKYNKFLFKKFQISNNETPTDDDSVDKEVSQIFDETDTSCDFTLPDENNIDYSNVVYKDSNS